MADKGGGFVTLEFQRKIYETYKSKHTLSKYADFKVACYAAMNEASMRLKGGLIFPLWEALNFNRLKHETEKIKNEYR